MTIEHKDIPDGFIHEPKGISGASSGQVYVSDGAASGNWELPKIQGQGAATADQTPVSTGGGAVTWVDKYSNLVINRLIDGESVAVSQDPAGLDTPLQLEFGPAIDAGEVTLSAAGAITFVTGGLYRVKVSVQLGRSGGAGTSVIFLRALVNGAQAGRSLAYKLDDPNIIINFSDEAWLDLPPGAIITYEMVRDSTGNNSGSAISTAPTLGWNTSPSAAVRVEKFE